MTEIKEDLDIIRYCTQYDVKQSTALMDAIRFLMSEEKSAKAALAALNKQIMNAMSKEQAFDVLIQIMPDCAQNVLDDNAKMWITNAVSKHENEIVAACRFKFLVELYHRCHTNQEFYKAVVSNFLPKIIDSCVWVHEKSAEAQHSLNCLYFTMKYFASACIVHKKKIEEYVLKFLDSSGKIAKIVQAAKCFHILNQIGGAGPNGSIHVKNFEDNFEKLYKTLNVLYNAMFENINEFRDITEDVTNVIPFKEIPTYLGTMDVYKILNRRMENTVIFLIEMLQTDYKVKKTIKPEILQVIQRGLDIHVHGDLNDPNRALFNQQIQQHQIKLLFLVKALIQSLQHNFMRHTTVKILFRLLARVTDCDCYNVNSFYKSTIYDVIKYWLECSGEQIDAKTYEKLMEIIVKDITPNKTTLVLQINLNNNVNSKGKNKAVTTASSAPSNVQGTPRVEETRIANCRGALGLLETLLKAVHLNIKKTQCAQLFHVITATLLDVCANHLCSPYTSKDCRLALFKVLVAVFDQPSFTIDIDLAVNILSLAQRSDDVEQALICQHGLKMLEKIVHPIQSALGQGRGQAEDAEEATQKEPECSSIKILSDYLIVANQENDEECPETPQDVSPEREVPQQMEAENAEDESESGGSQKAEKNVGSVVEISDNEVAIDNDNENENDCDVVSIEEDQPASKKRKADNQEVIFTFDISQGEELLESFVDEVN